MKSLKNLGKTALLAGGLAAVAGCSPQIKEVKDFTGNGLKDIMMEKGSSTYLFIQQDDGNYLTTIEDSDDGTAPYFRQTPSSDEGMKIYFFDGEFYRESPQTE